MRRARARRIARAAQLTAWLALLTWSMLAPRVALAHAPQAMNVALTPDGGAIALAMPGFGVLMRTRADQPFGYLCDALLDHMPSDAVPALSFLSDGSLLFGSSDGIRIVNMNACPAAKTEGALASAPIVGMDVHHATDTVYAASSGLLSAVWRSVDGGVSWEKRSTLVNADQVTALRVDPDAPKTLYISRGTNEKSVLLASTDGGATFSSSDEPAGFTIVHVQAGRLWAIARSADNTTNRGFDVLRADKPEGPWDSRLRVNYFGGLTVDDEGVVWVGDESGGFYRSTDDGAHFDNLAPTQTVGCLASAGNAVWSCAFGTTLQPALFEQPTKNDSKLALNPVATFADVDHLVDCSPELDVPATCEAAWFEWRRDVRLENLTPDAGTLPTTPDAGRDAGRGASMDDASTGDAATGDTPAKHHGSSSGCAVYAPRAAATSNTSTRASAWFGLAGCLLVLSMRRKRARLP